jgi:NAD(P)-dependent dehydrogenase (short-subunit alcohol dehydrogenase family)
VVVGERRVALITGAARGIGAATAATFAQRGDHVVLSDLDRRVESVEYATSSVDDLAATVASLAADGLSVESAPADVRDHPRLADIVSDVVGRHARLDYLVANAGIASFGTTTWAIDERTWQDMIDVTLTGTWNTCRAAIPSMIEAGNGGSIVLVSSTAALKSLPTIGHYSAAKAGLVGLMRSLALELAPHWIRVNTVHPGGTATPMTENERSESWQASVPGLNETLTLPMPIKRMEPSAIADTIAFLCSDAARYVTGTTAVVDAGALLR